MYAFPFTFAAAATAGLNRGDLPRCDLLRELGCHQRGLWRRECGCGGPEVAPWGAWAPPLGCGAEAAWQHLAPLSPDPGPGFATLQVSPLLVDRLFVTSPPTMFNC